MNDRKESLTIMPMSEKQLCDVIKPNQPFLVFGRLVPTFANGKWSWTEDIFETPYEKQYPDDEPDYSEYMHNPDKIIFLAYLENQCVGRIRLKRNWNNYCFIEDIAVASQYRRRGIGKKLIHIAEKWARDGKMQGLMLETQDINLAACRFYHWCGFVLGGVDTMLYTNTRNKSEIALFWYKQFK